MKTFFSKINWPRISNNLKLAAAYALKYLGMFLMVCFVPVFITGWLLHKVARLVLAISYAFMLDFRKTRDIIYNLFTRYDR